MMTIRTSAIYLGLLLALPCMALGADDVRMEEIRVKDVPTNVLAAANSLVPKSRWTTAIELSKQTGPTRLWYRLVGTQQVTPSMERVLTDGDVEQIPGKVRTVQVRIKANGEVIDFWSGIDPKHLPDEVLQALGAQTRQLQVVWAREVRLGTNDKIVGYRVMVEVNGGQIIYNVAADGSKVERASGI